MFVGEERMDEVLLKEGKARVEVLLGWDAMPLAEAIGAPDHLAVELGFVLVKKCGDWVEKGKWGKRKGKKCRVKSLEIFDRVFERLTERGDLGLLLGALVTVEKNLKKERGSAGRSTVGAALEAVRWLIGLRENEGAEELGLGVLKLSLTEKTQTQGARELLNEEVVRE
jgi:hypothetical protein